MSDMKNDVDPIETLEWLASLESLLLERESPRKRCGFKANRDYINTIPSRNAIIRAIIR